MHSRLFVHYEYLFTFLIPEFCMGRNILLPAIEIVG